MSGLWLIRHGETTWSATGRHTGCTDLALTPAGESAAVATGAVLAGQSFGLVLTSPLIRARETCRLAGLAEGAQVVDDLVEWNYGDYEGLTTPEIRAGRPDWLLWRDGCPGGEESAQVGARVDHVLARIRAAGTDTVLFAHGHVLRVLGARWVGLPPQDGSRLALSTAAICVLGYEREIPVIDRWNDTSHIPAD